MEELKENKKMKTKKSSEKKDKRTTI